MDSRPSLGFPLGTALLMMVIFTLTGIISCCYHWDKLRRYHAAADSADIGPSDMDLKQKQKQSLPVIMPGDNVPRFIALPCPCEPPRLGKIIVDVQKQPPPPPPMAELFH
ncbi:hypothetical protein CDL12_17596 [Handroanthus impetiginosus]|uniref:Hydroxyproline-rich glycoprotein family protein n=1 Tax=Handroanthus impetiginosus TaxID=429701 RepID=A0A2G9GA72_9LAMI|nr:hypothetical protein CDL12_25299 [Handroanthus impetiginosus]PIN09819.1 hypothetical protein CDL12_17596 [Handroanthus impetiginosus]